MLNITKKQGQINPKATFYSIKGIYVFLCQEFELDLKVIKSSGVTIKGTVDGKEIHADYNSRGDFKLTTDFKSGGGVIKDLYGAYEIAEHAIRDEGIIEIL